MNRQPAQSESEGKQSVFELGRTSIPHPGICFSLRSKCFAIPGLEHTNPAQAGFETSLQGRFVFDQPPVFRGTLVRVIGGQLRIDLDFIFNESKLGVLAMTS